jgi:hypothetical protein
MIRRVRHGCVHVDLVWTLGCRGRVVIAVMVVVVVATGSVLEKHM